MSTDKQQSNGLSERSEATLGELIDDYRSVSRNLAPGVLHAVGEIGSNAAYCVESAQFLIKVGSEQVQFEPLGSLRKEARNVLL